MSTISLEQDLRRIYRKQNLRDALCITVLALLILILGILMMTVGNTHYSLREVFYYLNSEETKGAAYTIRALRLPKLLVGGAAGFAFGIAGYSFQNLLHNPLASPDIIGVTAGSSAAAVFCILILGVSGGTASAFAVVSGLIVTALIFVLSGKGGAFSARMILIGIGMQAVLNALISWMLLIGSEYDVATALRWLRGSLNDVQMSDVPITLTVTVLGSALLLICNRYLRLMQLGDAYAIPMGIPVGKVRLCIMLCALLLSATATSVTGPIASVAFLSGPIAVKCTGNGKSAMTVSGLMGMLLVYAGELVGKNLLPAKYPVGVITGLLGAPYLLILLMNINKKGEKI
ncbi:MAG: iron ABC transporter permease [Lachnospiraceae bacterium]|nr:iron ABC transporter permease [Lachnospiraceae bacterium]